MLHINQENPEHQQLAVEQFRKECTKDQIEEFVLAIESINPGKFKTWYERLTLTDLQKVAELLKKSPPVKVKQLYRNVPMEEDTDN